MTGRNGAGGHDRSRVEIAAWDTREPLAPVFRAAWEGALRDSAHAHFALGIDFLLGEAERQRHTRALLIEGGGRRGLLVQRRSGRRWVSGWPWRWQALVCDADPHSPLGMTAADAAWLHESACRYNGDHELLTYLPHAPVRPAAGWRAGSTVLQELQHSDEALFESMEPSKRRLVRRARSHDFEVAAAASDAERRAFHGIQQESKSRLGLPVETTPDRVARPGESWREWELPWMWLLVVRRHGEVQAGVGSGVRPGGVMQGRTAAARLEARRLGATALLGYEESRRGRDLGHRWFNHGGDTPFKREMSGRFGRRIRVFGWLGDGGGRALWHHGEAVLRDLKPALARLRRRLRIGRRATHIVLPIAGLLIPLLADLPVWA